MAEDNLAMSTSFFLFTSYVYSALNA